MIGLLQAEIRKLTSVRSWWVLMVGTAAFPVLTVVAFATDPSTDASTFDSATLLSLMRSGAQIAAVASLLLGILAVAGEYRHGTMITTVLSEPRRSRVIGAKLIVLSGAGVVLAAVTVVTNVFITGLYLNSIGVDVLAAPAADALAVLGGVLFVGGLYGGIGAAVGAAVRNQVAAITGALVWLLAVEGVLPVFLRKPGLRDWMVSGAAERLYQLPDPAPGSPSAVAAAGVLVMVAAVAGLAGMAVTHLVDID